MRKRILVTGGTGFIGSHLVKALTKEGYTCTVLDRKKYPFSDIRKLTKVIRGNNFIIHLAGQAKGESSEIVSTNVGSTLSLLEAISKIPGKKPVFVFASSFAVYGTGNKILNEKSSLSPRNIYGFSKLWSEEILEHYSKEQNIPSVVLRLSNVYGKGAVPFGHSVVATFIRQIKNNTSLTINGDGRQTRDFVYVDDVVNAFLCALKKRREGSMEIINICSSQKKSLKELIKIIQQESGENAVLTYNRSIKEKGYWIGSNKKAKKVLGWKPEIELREGIRLILKS